MDSFHKCRRLKGGRHLVCKDCRNEKGRKEYERNHEAYLTARRQKRNDDPEKYREYMRRYRTGEKLEKHRENNRSWRERNRTKHNEINRRHYAANSEKRKLTCYKRYDDERSTAVGHNWLM
jgi:hypothetical protein